MKKQTQKEKDGIAAKKYCIARCQDPQYKIRWRQEWPGLACQEDFLAGVRWERARKRRKLAKLREDVKLAGQRAFMATESDMDAFPGGAQGATVIDGED